MSEPLETEMRNDIVKSPEAMKNIKALFFSFKELNLFNLNPPLFYAFADSFNLHFTDKKISSSLENLTIGIDLRKNHFLEISSL